MRELEQLVRYLRETEVAEVEEAGPLLPFLRDQPPRLSSIPVVMAVCSNAILG